MIEDLLVGITLAFTIPVLASSYYSLILMISSFMYPQAKDSGQVLDGFPPVSIIIAIFNERFVVSKSLDALKNLDYPKNRLQVIVADDSTDETRQIIDQKVLELQSAGLSTVVSRRESREGFKSGALNQAAKMVSGEYVLLLDADSIVTPNVLTRGLRRFQDESGLGFVSYRVGHYNREQSLITRLFALSLDLGDTLNKMGAHAIGSPFSFQGGYTLISSEILRGVGYWSADSIVDDADLSCKVYASGKKGTYLSDVRIFGEDLQTLETWKKQAARVSQGWAKCLSDHWRTILRTPHMSRWRRAALLLFLFAPFASLSWLVVSFTSATAVVLHISTASNSIFSNPWYVTLVSLPISSFFIAAAQSMRVQSILTKRNLLLIPVLSYTGCCMFTASSVGFLRGLRGEAGFFFRTPKTGGNLPSDTDYFRALTLDKLVILEFILSIIAIVLSAFMFINGVWFLGLSLLGFGLLTLKSLGLSRLLRLNLHTLNMLPETIRSVLT